MKTTAYLRISTIDQDIEKNKSDILKLANEKHLGMWSLLKSKYPEKCRGKKEKSIQLFKMRKKMMFWS